MDTNLSGYIKLCHSKGFRVAVLINTFKKKQRAMKAVNEVPEEVLIDVCKEFLKEREILIQWPYFMKVLNMKLNGYYAKKTQEEARKAQFSRSRPQHLKELLK